MIDECELCGEEADLLRPLDPRAGHNMLVCGDCRRKYEDGPEG